MSTCATVSIGFGEVRPIGMNAEDHVGRVESDCCIAMGGKVIEELFAFFHVDLAHFACSLAIMLRAMRTVRLTAQV
jgi:hypothetical protein